MWVVRNLMQRANDGLLWAQMQCFRNVWVMLSPVTLAARVMPIRVRGISSRAGTPFTCFRAFWFVLLDLCVRTDLLLLDVFTRAGLLLLFGPIESFLLAFAELGSAFVWLRLLVLMLMFLLFSLAFAEFVGTIIYREVLVLVLVLVLLVLAFTEFMRTVVYLELLQLL